MKSISSKENSCRLLALWLRTGMVALLFQPYTYCLGMLKKEQYIIFFKTLHNRFIIAGYYNAKHMHWDALA